MPRRSLSTGSIAAAALALALGLAAGHSPATAGQGTTILGLVNLDENKSATRFGKLKAALEKAYAPRKDSVDGYVGVREIGKEVVGPVTADCTLKDEAKFQQARIAMRIQGVLLYCSSGAEPIIRVSLYTQWPGRAAVVELRPRAGKVGRSVLVGVAQTAVAFADTFFVP